MLRKCTKCKEVKDGKEYYIRSCGKTYPHCKECHNGYSRGRTPKRESAGLEYGRSLKDIINE